MDQEGRNSGTDLFLVLTALSSQQMGPEFCILGTPYYPEALKVEPSTA